MYETSQFRSILMVDVTLIAGLLILLTLFPIRPEFASCDWALQFRQVLQGSFIYISSIAFFGLTGSAFISFTMTMRSLTPKDKKYFEKAFETWEIPPGDVSSIKKIVLFLPYGLTFLGLVLLLIVAYYLLASTAIIPNSAGCFGSINERIALSDVISAR